MNQPQYNDNPLVSIITLNWNHTDVTCAFLESTRKLKYRNFEILVCDMNSDIDPAEQIHSLHVPNTTLLQSKKNLGFAAGNNWGMRQAKGDFIFIVNNDTEVTPDLLDLLLEPFYADPSIGVTCPKIRYYSHPNIIQYAGFSHMNSISGRAFSIGDKEVDTGQYDKSGYTFGAHGCAMMVKRAVIEKVGMFPEKFFLYYEEWDWSSRIQKAGYHIYYQSKALIYHKESISVGKNSPLKTYYITRNRILYMRRNTSIPKLFVFMLFFIFAAMPKAIVSFLFKKEYGLLKAYWKAVIWNLTHSSYSVV